MILTPSRCSPSSSRRRARPATSRSASGRTSERALLASAGVNVRSTEPAAHVRRLAWWSLLVAVLIALEYASRVSNGTPDRNVLYEYSTAIGSAAVYAVLLFIVVRIAGFRRDLL